MRLDGSAVGRGPRAASLRRRPGAHTCPAGASFRSRGGRDEVDQGTSLASGAPRQPCAAIVLLCTRGKAPDDLLLTTSRGSQLHRSAVLRTLAWSATGQGRRLHDLRHTAACLWLARGVDPGTVQAWMGHKSIAMTNGYLHHLGTSADLAGLDRLNTTPGGARGERDRDAGMRT